MNWEIIRADEFCESVRDGTHDTPKEVENGYKLVTAKHIRDGQIYPEEAYNISEKDYLKICERSKVEQWDVLMSMIGNGLGRSAVVKDVPRYAIKNLALFKVGDEVKAKWLHYYLSSEAGQGLIYNSLQGSGQPFISLNLLRSFPIPMPPYETAKRIIDIVSKYDDLIENNQKQIKLLEEAAQRLYKEWFVDLRFPGHETTTIIDRVPVGWHETTIGEYLTVRSGYAFKSGWWQSEGHPIVKIKNINNNTIDMAETDYVSPERTKAIPEFKLSKGDVVVAMTGATIGKIGLVPEVDNLYTNQRVGKVFPNEGIINPTPFVFCFYAQESVREKIIALSSSSSAQPNISGKQLESLEIIANTDIINLFCEGTMPFFEKINSLRKQITLLVQARDRLLPKLMNGEIEV